MKINSSGREYRLEVLIDPNITMGLIEKNIPIPRDNIVVTGLHKYVFNKSYIILNDPNNLVIETNETPYTVERLERRLVNKWIKINGTPLIYTRKTNEYYLLLDYNYGLVNLTIPRILSIKYTGLEQEDYLLGHNISVKGIYILVDQREL